MARNRDNNQGSSPFSFGGSSGVPGQAAGGSGTGSAGVPGQAAGGQSAAGHVPGQTAGVAEGRSRGRDPFGAGVPGQGAAGASTGGELFAPPSGKQDDPGVAYGYRKSLLGHKDEVSVYTAQMDARHAMDPRVRAILIAGILAVVLIPVIIILPKGLSGPGMPGLSPAYIVESVGNNITGLVNWVSGGPVTTGVSILFWQVAAIAFVGAALAINGCVFQGALKNALAAPSTLGVMSGATLGTLIYTLAFGVPQTAQIFTVIQSSELREQLQQMDVGSYIFATQGRALCSMLGCFVVVGLVLLIAHIAGRGKVSKVALLIAGQVFAALVTGVIAVIRTYLLYYGTEAQQQALLSIVGGDVSSITDPLSFATLVVPLVIGIVFIMAMRFRLNLLAFGDEEAKSMGISTMRTRNLVILVCTALTGVVVSFVGSVGFVGFLVPHLARKVVGPDFRYLVPASALFGSVFLLVAYYLMQATTLFSGSLGTLTSIVGAVFFLVAVIRERARGNVDWV